MTDTNNSLDLNNDYLLDATPRPQEPDTARFATFNTLHGRVPKGRVDLSAFAGAVAGLGADVVGLQEVDKGMVRTRWADMAARAGRKASMEYFFGRAFRRWDFGLYGNALLSQEPMTHLGTLELPRRSRNEEPRSAILATVPIRETVWSVATTHLSLDQASSADQLDFLLKAAAELPGPRVVMGDFNRKPNNVEPTAAALGWSVAPTGFTYPSWNPEICIDFVLVQGARVASTEVCPLPVSDHCAVIAELEPE